MVGGGGQGPGGQPPWPPSKSAHVGYIVYLLSSNYLPEAPPVAE